MANVMKHNYLFATLVSEFEYVADKTLLYTIKNEDMNEQKMIFHSTASVDNKLQEKKEYQPLVKTILDNIKEICKMYQYEYEELEITNMWINYSQKGDMHSPHTHSNNTFSGVWYPFHSKTQTPIFFQDPRPSSGVWQPRKTKVNTLTSTLMSFQQQKDMGLIFPSWLVHYVPPAASPRISISWNVLLRGEYGEPDTLQNAYI